MLYPLPNDTVAILKTNSAKISNLGLAIDKYLKVYELSDRDERDKPIKSSEVWKHPPEIKLRKWAAEHSQIKTEMQTIVKSVAERHEALLKSVNARTFIAAPDYRVVVGFGAEHVLETNLYLHRIYGFPVIPGSALKGLARAFAFWELAAKLQLPALDFDELDRRKRLPHPPPSPLQLLDKLLSEGEDRKREKALGNLKEEPNCRAIESLRNLTLAAWKEKVQDFYTVFGTQSNRGSITFFDAYPTTAPKLEPDILNPHFPDYYGDKNKRTPPSDNQNPKPNYFLTVAANQEFRFAVAGNLAEKAEAWLKQGLATLGVGGKTSSGYGFMNEIIRHTPEQQAENSLLLQIQKLDKKVVFNQLGQYVTQWRNLPDTAPHKKTVAVALLEKVKEADRVKESKNKAWYQELLACVGS